MPRRGAPALITAVAAAVVTAPLAAHAQPPPPTGRPIVLAPLSSLGAESTSAETRKLQTELEAALAEVGRARVVGVAAALDQIKKARKPQLRTCDGDTGCLADLAALVGAELVVYGEVGGLGDVQVVYLQLVDAGGRKEVRSTTLQLGAAGAGEGGARGAAVRLLAPERFVGQLAVAVDAPGASIYVDGKRVAKSGSKPVPPVALPVGTHALRVTHPEFRDFVRFVDVGYDQTTTVEAPLQQYPVVTTDFQRDGSATSERIRDLGTEPSPWYRSWYAVAGFGAVVLTGAVVAGVLLGGGLDVDRERPVDPP